MSTQADALLADTARRWKVTLPTDTKTKGKADEYAGAELTKVFGKTPWFRANPAATGISFRAPVNGVTTSGSKNPRAELRELNDDGTLAAWSGSVGVHTITIVESFDELPKVKPDLVGLQIHNAENDVSVWRLEGTRLYVTEGNNDTAHLVDPNYVLGTPFEAAYIVVGGTLTAFYNGRLVATIKVPNLVGAYFKAGAYTQANPSNSKPVDASNAGQVTVYSLMVAHTSSAGPVPAPPPPAPAPAGAGTIMVIRHGEKPSDKNDHTLAPKGRARAAALPALFTGHRADLPRPTWIFASKGTTTSMRMLQTAQPTAAALGLPIDTRYDSENAVALTAKLLVDKAKAGEDVLAVLEHSCIAAVLAATADLLGCKDKTMGAYPDARFDLGAKYSPSGAGYRYTEFDERVLPGDRGYEPPPVQSPPVQPPPVVTPPVVTPPGVDPPPDAGPPPAPDPQPEPEPGPEPEPAPEPGPPTPPQPAPPPRPTWFVRFWRWLFGRESS